MVSYPKDWQSTPFHDFSTLMVDGPFGSDLKTEHYTDKHEVRIIQLGNIGENGWRNENVKYTTFSHAETLKRCITAPGELLIAKMMPAGRAILCPSGEKECIISSDVVRIILDHNVDSRFVVYSTKGEYYLKQIAENTQGSTRQRTSIRKLKKIKLMLPNHEEQKAIADALSSFDTHIANLAELIEKKKGIRDGALTDLINCKIRLKGFRKNWKSTPFAQFTVLMVDGPFGSDLKTEHYTLNHEARVIQLSNIGEDGWNDVNTKYTTFAHATELSRCITKPGELLIAKMMPAGRAILCPSGEAMYIISSDVVRVIVNNDVDSRFVVYSTKGEYYLNQIAENMQGSTRQRTSIRKLKKIRLMLPEYEEQKAIADVLTAMDDEIRNLVNERNKMIQIREGTMEDLLTGRVRLTV